MIADLVYEITATSGTGPFTLGGARSAEFRTFASAHSVGDTVYYCCRNGGQWEVGLGTLTSSTTLARTTVYNGSSGAGVAVNFAAGNKELYETLNSGSMLDLSSLAASNALADSDKVLVLKADGSLATILGSIIKASGTGTGTPAATVSSVTVSPPAPTLAGGATQTFTATVTGTNNPAQTVMWAASAGSITSSGVFTAPAATGSAQTITVTATSTADNTKSGTATVTVSAAEAGATYDTLLDLRGVTASGSNPASYAGDGTMNSENDSAGGVWSKRFAANTDGFVVMETTSTNSQWFLAVGSVANSGTLAPRSYATLGIANAYGPTINYELHKPSNGLVYSGTPTTPNAAFKPEVGDRVKIERINSAGGNNGATLIISVARAATPNTFVELWRAANFFTEALGVRWHITGTPAITKLQSSGLVAF